MSTRSWIALVAMLVLGTPLTLALSGCVFDSSGLAGDPLPPEQSQNNSYRCYCDCGATDARSATVLMLASADDAEEVVADHSVYFDGVSLELVPGQLVGLRFPHVAIEQGATIESAYVQLTTAATDNLTTAITIGGQASDDAAPFTNAASDVSSRLLTAASLPWSPGPWLTVNQAGGAQQTPELKTIVQEVVARPGWTSGNALALVMQTSGGRRRAWAYDHAGSQAATLVVSWKSNRNVNVDLTVCVPAALDRNVTPGDPVTDAQLTSDCEGRVETTLNQLTNACRYPACDCTAGGSQTPTQPRFAASCDAACTEVPLETATCSNFDSTAEPPDTTATNVAGGVPVCSPNSALTAAVFGRRSLCDVSGTATVTADGHSPDGGDPAASGTVEFLGGPCPGGSCPVGLAYRMGVAPVTFSNFWGSATFEDIVALGGSVENERATLTSGAGAFGPNTTENWGRGRRGSEVNAFVLLNENPIVVGVDWDAETCSVSGSLAGAADPEARFCENGGPHANEPCTGDAFCGSDPACTDGVCNCVQVESSADMVFALNVTGTLLNQPPVADAGPDRPAVECNVPGGARLLLDGTGTTDQDGNVADARWLLGGRTGPAVGFGLTAAVDQSLGTHASYVLRVIDAYGQSGEDETEATVVDTTAPVIACNAPATMAPPSAPVSFQATAADVCDPAVTPTLSGATCFTYNKTGKKVYRDQCVVTLQGDTITVSDSGGVDDWVYWTASAGDDSGNPTSLECSIHVVRPKS